MIKESEPPIMVKLYHGTWMHYNPLHFLEYNNSNSPIQKGVIVSRWITSEEKISMNCSSTLLNIDGNTLFTEINPCGIIAIPAI